MKLRKIPAALAATVLLGAGLAGCSSSGGSTEGQTIKWWATQQTSTIGDSDAAYKTSIERFTKETGIKVEVEVIPWTDLYNKILTAVSSGTGPDVLTLGTTWTASLQDTGALAELNKENLALMGGKDRFVASAWDAMHVPDTTQTSVPFLTNVYSMYYNTKLFKEAGITTPPATWEDFVDTAKKLTKDTDGDGKIDQWGFTREGAAATGNAHLAFILGQQLGGNFVDSKGKPSINSPEQIKAVDAYVDLMAKDKVMASSDAEIDQGANAQAQLMDGKAAMFFSQNPVEQFKSRNFTDWAIAPMPVMKGGKDIESMVAGVNLSVFEDSKNKEAAFAFVKHLTSPSEQAVFSNTFGMLPAVTEAYETAPFKDNGDTTIATRKKALETATASFPLVSNIGEIEAAVGNAVRESLQAYATGKDPDVAGRLTKANDQLH